MNDFLAMLHRAFAHQLAATRNQSQNCSNARQSSVLFETLARRLELRRFPRVAPLGAARPQKRGGEGPTGRNDRGVRGSPGRRRGAAHSTWEVAGIRLFLAERCRTSIKNVDFSI